MSLAKITIASLSILAMASACGGADEVAETQDELVMGTFIDWDSRMCGSQEQMVQPVDPYVGSTSFRIYPRVQNETDHDFNSSIGVYISAKVIETNEVLKATTYIGSRSSLAEGTTRYVLNANRSRHQMDTPAAFLRWGHDTPQSGECQATIRIKTTVSLDPDLHIDDDPSNDDCLADNTKYYYKDFMQECPW